MHIGIIGYGKMGSAIFKWLAQKPYSITVFMRSKEKALDSKKRFFRRLERQQKRSGLTDDDLHRKMESLRFTHRLEDLSPAQLVIESMTEAYNEKARVFRELESVVDTDSTLVTNTSSISIEDLAKNLRHPGRFCGLHFFHPVMLIDLVEIIKWDGTSGETISFLKSFCERIGRRGILVHDAPGSVINSILAYYYLEALYILEEGCALPSKVDELAKQFFYIGPCESMDIIGIDFFMAALKGSRAGEALSSVGSDETSSADSIQEDNGGRRGFFMPFLFEKLVSENRLGKKAAKGIYLYEKEKPVDDAPGFYRNPARENLLADKMASDALSAKRLLFSVFNGSLYCYRRSLGTLEDLDHGVKEALQMNRGPFSMMEAIGKEEIKKDFDFLSQQVGERFTQNDLHLF